MLLVYSINALEATRETPFTRRFHPLELETRSLGVYGAMECDSAMECGYASTYRGQCMYCSKPIGARCLQVGVLLNDVAWGQVTKWSHPACAKLVSVADLQGFDELKPADQESLRSLAQDGPRSGGELHRKRQRCVEEAPVACSPATALPLVAAQPCGSEAQWPRGCFDACPLAVDEGDEHLLHHLTRLEQAYRSRLPASLADSDGVSFNLTRGRGGAQSRLAMLFDAPVRKERLGPEGAKAVFKALAGPNPQGQCWKGWRQSSVLLVAPQLATPASWGWCSRLQAMLNVRTRDGLLNCSGPSGRLPP